MKCPYCGTENPDDAQECSNCSADLGSLFKGTPPPESYAPTMMTSSAEVAAMLAAARGEQEAPAEPVEESSESPAEPAEPEEPAQPEEVPPTPDYAAPTMMTSSAEVAAMLAEARGEPEPEPETPPAPPSDYAAPTMMTSSAEVAAMLAEARGEPETPAQEPLLEEPLAEELPMEEMPVEEVPMEVAEVPMGDPGAFAPTMISAVPDEVAEIIAAAKASEPVVETPVEEPAAPTFVGIPDPLGVSDSGKFAAPDPEPVTPPPPAYQEPVLTPSPASTPDAPKDNRKMWIIGGVSCFVIFCCVCVIIPAIMFVVNYQQIAP